jgi:hypothetical protein
MGLEGIKIIGANALTVYLCMAASADENNETTISYQTIRDWTGFSRTTIAAAIRTLISHNLIQPKRRFSASTVYTLISPDTGLIDPPLVQILIIISPDSGRLTTTTIKESINNIESINSSSSSIKRPKVGLMDYSSPENGLMDGGRNGRFDEAGAQALIMQLTGWARIPGNNDEAMHALGAVIDLHDKHGDDTLDYLRPFWDEFRRRYPRSTRVFWLTDWAVQGVIPDDKKRPSRRKTKEEIGVMEEW